MASTIDYSSWPAPAARFPRPVTLFPTYQPSPPPSPSPTQFPLQPYPQHPRPPRPPLPLPHPHPETPTRQARRARTLTTTSHALALFTVFGITASSPLWLEYYFTALYPGTSLQMLAAVFAALMGGVWAGYVGGWLLCGVSGGGEGSGEGKGKGKREEREKRSRRKKWRWCRPRLAMLLGALFATISFAVLAALAALLNPIPNVNGRDPGIAVWVLVLLQGALPGLALGVCLAGSMRVLRGHYGRRAGAMCHVAGWAGAVVYSVVVWAVLRRGGGGVAFGVVAGGAVVTLGGGVVLARPCEGRCEKKGGGTATISPVFLTIQRHCLTMEAATTLVVHVLIVPPLFSPLLLLYCLTPSSPNTALYVLVALYASAAASSSLVPHIDLVRLKRKIMLAGCLAIAALATLPLIWERRVWVAVYWAVIYGAAVGGVGVLVAKDDGGGEERRGKELGGEGNWSWESVLIRAIGLVVGVAGVVGCALLIVSVDNGVDIMLGVVVGMLGSAAVGMGVLGLMEGTV